MKYAGFFRRLAANLIDCFVIMGFYVVFAFLFSISFISQFLLNLPILGIWLFLGIFSFSWLYFSLFESSTMQATIGKKVMGLKVVDLRGRRLKFSRATGRYFGKLLSRMTFMIGFFMIAFTKKKQALHDKLARSLVIVSR